jgi:hypothetical protein
VSPGGRSRRLRTGLITAGIAAGIVLAGLGVAGAQESPSTTAPAAPDAKPPATDIRPAPGPGPGFRFHGPGGHGGGPMFFKGFMGGGIHGEFTTPAPNGGYRTIASQVGEVTSVSNSSITVKSEDGFSKAYKVTEDTLVNAGRDGIGSVKNGDQVRLTALVEDGTAGAVQIMDVTNLERFGEKWWPRPR